MCLPLPGEDLEQFSVYVVPSEATPTLFGLELIREFGLVIDASLSQCCSTRLHCRIPLTVMPSGHAAIPQLPPGLSKQPPTQVAFAMQADESQST